MMHGPINIRIMLLRFIGYVCSLANHEFPIQGHDESPASLKTGNFTEFPNVLKNDGPLL